MQLIKIETCEGKQTVNARELHAFLEVKTRFNDWITGRIEQYGFVENQDFVIFTENSVKLNRDNPAQALLQIPHRKQMGLPARGRKEPRRLPGQNPVRLPHPQSLFRPESRRHRKNL